MTQQPSTPSQMDSACSILSQAKLIIDDIEKNQMWDEAPIEKLINDIKMLPEEMLAKMAYTQGVVDSLQEDESCWTLKELPMLMSTIVDDCNSFTKNHLSKLKGVVIKKGDPIPSGVPKFLDLSAVLTPPKKDCVSESGLSLFQRMLADLSAEQISGIAFSGSDEAFMEFFEKSPELAERLKKNKLFADAIKRQQH